MKHTTILCLGAMLSTLLWTNTSARATTSDTLSIKKIGFSGSTARTHALKGGIPKRWKWHGGHYSGFGLSYNGLVQGIGTMTLPSDAKFMQQTPKSIGVNINFVDFTIVSNRHFGLITGLGLEVNNFRFDRNMTLAQDAKGQIVPRYFDDINLSKSKLTTTYLNIPLLAEFQFGRSKKGKMMGYVNFGVTAGIRLEGHTKYKSKDTGVQKQHGGLNLRNFHYGAEINVGYSHYGIFARYYPHSIFINDGGPNVQQVNIGVLFTI